MTTSEGRATIMKGWEGAHVAAVVEGKTAFPEEDPFSNVFFWQ